MKHTAFIILILTLLMPAAHAADVDKEFILVIDAGHGGKDPGAVNGRKQEKNINLAVALKMGELIEKKCKNVKIIYTRKTDVFVELYRRAEIANKAGADMFISIHTNSNTTKSVKGAETYLLGVEDSRTQANLNVAIAENNAIMYEPDRGEHYEGYDPKSPETMIIFEFLQNEHQGESFKMANFIQDRMTGYAGRPDRGVHQAGYLVLWKNSMPSILVELGYISNTDECSFLTSQTGIDKMAGSLALGFSDYLSEYRTMVAKSVKYGENKDNGKALEEPSAQVNEADNSSSTGTLWKIQFLTSNQKLADNDRRLRNLKQCSYYKESGLYKYTCGDSSDKKAVNEYLKEVRMRYPDAFIVRFDNGKKHTAK